MSYDVYVASSWRNNYHTNVIEALEKAGLFPYNFRDSDGFSWSEIDKNWENWNYFEYLSALMEPQALRGFGRDFGAMHIAKCCVLVLPAGRSANLELGWFVGQGKPTCVYIPEFDTPDLMYKMADLITSNLDYVIEFVENEIL